MSSCDAMQNHSDRYKHAHVLTLKMAKFYFDSHLFIEQWLSLAHINACIGRLEVLDLQIAEHLPDATVLSRSHEQRSIYLQNFVPFIVNLWYENCCSDVKIIGKQSNIYFRYKVGSSRHRSYKKLTLDHVILAFFTTHSMRIWLLWTTSNWIGLSIELNLPSGYVTSILSGGIRAFSGSLLVTTWKCLLKLASIDIQ